MTPGARGHLPATTQVTCGTAWCLFLYPDVGSTAPALACLDKVKLPFLVLVW